MVLHEYAGRMDGIDLPVGETLHDDVTRLQLVVAFHLSLGHVVGAGNGIVEVVGMCGADVGDVASGLCPSGCIGGVGVHDASDFGICSVEYQMGWGVGRRIQVAFHHLACFKVDHDHVAGFHGVVVDTRWLDDHQSFFTVDARDVAPGKNNEIVLHQVEVCTEYFLFQFFKHKVFWF